MNQVLQLADVAFTDLFEQPSHRALIGNPHPAGHTLQHPVGPQDQALAEATCTARQANEHQKNGFAKQVACIGLAFVAHHLVEQTAESQAVEELDHRNQSGLAGQVPSAGFGADFRRRSACPVRLFSGLFAHGKGDSSG